MIHSPKSKIKRHQFETEIIEILKSEEAYKNTDQKFQNIVAIYYHYYYGLTLSSFLALG